MYGNASFFADLSWKDCQFRLTGSELKRKKKNKNMHACHCLFKRVWVSAGIRPASLRPCHLPLPAVPSRSSTKLGGRCCCAKLALKCFPGSPVSHTTQSNHIRSLYVCLGQVRHCSCVHPHSTFGVEGPLALNVRP